MLIVLLIRGLTLPGAAIGIQFYLYPDLGRLADPQVPIQAKMLKNRSIDVHKVINCLYYKPKNKRGVTAPTKEGTPGAVIPWFSAGEPSFCWVHLLSIKEAGAAGIKRRARTPPGL